MSQSLSGRKGYHISDQYATYFVTFTVVGWVDLFSRRQCKDIFMDSLKYCRQHKQLHVHAFVIMESHIHLVLSAVDGSAGLSAIIRDMKKFTSKKLLDWCLHSRLESRRKWLEVVFAYHAKYNSNNSNYQVWIQNNHPEILLYPRFTMRKIDYIHNNPVVAGIVDRADEYVYSSSRNYVGRRDYLFDVDVIDFGVQEGYIMT